MTRITTSQRRAEMPRPRHKHHLIGDDPSRGCACGSRVVARLRVERRNGNRHIQRDTSTCEASGTVVRIWIT